MSDIGSTTIGEKFDPAKDCSDIVENRPEAKDGFYWIGVGEGEAQKVGLFLQILTKNFVRH